MEKRLGQRNGDMPKYFAWKEKAIPRRGSLKYRCSSVPTDSQGRRWGTARRAAGRSKSMTLWNGDSRIGRNRASLVRLSSMNLRKNCASRGQIVAISSSIFATSGVASSLRRPCQRRCDTEDPIASWEPPRKDRGRRRQKSPARHGDRGKMSALSQSETRLLRLPSICRRLFGKRAR